MPGMGLEWRGLAHVVRVDARLLRHELRIVAVIRDAVMIPGYADLRVIAAAQLARQPIENTRVASICNAKRCKSNLNATWPAGHAEPPRRLGPLRSAADTRAVWRCRR
jgi:hypothetical protein